MRLIDADALIDIFEDRLEKIRNRYGDYSGEAGVCAGALHLIRVQPTIEPERKRGRWIDEGVYADGHGAHAFRCSECGGHIIEYDADPFCKWCGADMRGSEK